MTKLGTDAPATRVVVLFIPHLGIGGAELQLGMLATRLPGVGWQPVVATMEDLHGTATGLAEAGIPVQILPREHRTGLDTIRALARLVRKRRASVVHAWLWASNWRAAAARLLVPRTPVIASIRGMEDDLRPLHQLAYRVLSPFINVFIVNSVAVLEHSASRTGIPKERYRLLRNGVLLDEPESSSSSEPNVGGCLGSAATVGYIGTLSTRKRTTSLPSIARRILLQAPQARFLVVGDGPERPQLEAEIERLGVQDRFELVGYQRDVRPFLRRMSVLLHPSKSEGTSNSILEAMSSGIPVVAYDVSGNRGVVRDGVTGRLVADGSEEGLAIAVSNLILNPGEAGRFGAAGRNVIATEYSVDAMVRATAAVYEDVLSRK